MRGQLHLRRAGMVSAGTLALVLTSAASPAVAADEAEDQNCKDADSRLSTVTGVVCDTTDTATKTLDAATGGATKDASDGVKDVTGGVTGAVDEATSPSPGDGGGSGPSSPSDEGDLSTDDSDRDGSDAGGGGDEDSGGTVGAAGSPAGARSQAAGGGGGRFPYLQPLSPLAGLHSASSPDRVAAAALPELPEIAPSPVPSPEPPRAAEPEVTQYAAPAGKEEPYDRGEATPAMMVIFAIIAAGVVTGGHVAVAQARVRSRRVG